MGLPNLSKGDGIMDKHEIDEILQHAGVKGMRWGVRREKRNAARALARSARTSERLKVAGANAKFRETEKKIIGKTISKKDALSEVRDALDSVRAPGRKSPTTYDKKVKVATTPRQQKKALKKLERAKKMVDAATMELFQSPETRMHIATGQAFMTPKLDAARRGLDKAQKRLGNP